MNLFLAWFISLPLHINLAAFAQTGSLAKQTAMTWRILDDGSFDLEVADLSIKSFFPQIDGQTIHSLAVSVDRDAFGGAIIYKLQGNKEVRINLSRKGSNLILSSTLKGFSSAPEYFSPAASGRIEGADRIFKQGLGFAGPGAIMDIPRTNKRVDLNGLHEHVWSYDSYLASGILSPRNTTIAVGCYDHKNYLQRSTYYNKQTRFGLTDRWEASNLDLMDIGFSTERCATNGGDLNLPDLFFYSGDQPYKVFQQFAKDLAIANKVTLNQPPAYHWCSWYETDKKFNEQILNDVLSGLKKLTPAIPIQTIQIDDGYFTNYGDWLHFDSTKFPSGMRNVVKKVKSLGYRAGIWVGPFMVNEKSELFKNHPDWILKHLDGTMVVEWESKDGNTYILDTSHPDAFQYLRTVFRRLRTLGFTYYKTDFMDWGLRNSLKYKRHAPGKTSAQHLDDVLRMIKQEIGEESFWLGCIMPFPSAVGYVDGIRTSNDVGHKWASSSHGNMIQESLLAQYTNNILWQTDPDVLYLNSFKTELTNEECTTLALFDGILGGVINTSDRFHNMSSENQKLWRFIQPGKIHSAVSTPYWDRSNSIKVLVREHDGNNGAILFTNDSDSLVSKTFLMSQLVSNKQKYMYQWQPGKSTFEGLKKEIDVKLLPHNSILYYYSDEQKGPANNLGLYGSPIKGL